MFENAFIYYGFRNGREIFLFHISSIFCLKMWYFSFVQIVSSNDAIPFKKSIVSVVLITFYDLQAVTNGKM